ncbi:MAG TPA: TonB-dependent receptor [Candidatus Competibacteraceae bacterium]|nr:TonB-dependent receptor [Candidatus Competibacteraceae bacterium]
MPLTPIQRRALTLAALCATPALAQETLDQEGETERLSTLVVSATRVEAPVSSIPGSVTVIEGEQLREQINAHSTLGAALGKLVPGLALGSEATSNYGQTLRGRQVAVLIDGIPQNTVRNGARNLNTIDPSAIERVEVIRGATAIYGNGATGGIINIITRRPGDDGLRLHSEVTGSLSLTHPADSLSLRLSQGVSGRQGAWDYLLQGAAEQTGSFFDAEGDRIPPDPYNQGGSADTLSWNVLGKLGLAIDAQQRLELTVDYYDTEQDTEYLSERSVNSLPPRSHKARARPGLVLDEPQGGYNSLLSLDYRHQDLLGSALHAQLYRREYETRFVPFDGRHLASNGNTVFQSRIESESQGGRLEIDTPLLPQRQLSVLWGLDLSREQTQQRLTIFDPQIYEASDGLVFSKIGDKPWTPLIDMTSAALFAQLEWQPDEAWLLRGGARHERIAVDLDDFITPAGDLIRGGDLKFSDTVFNLGAVYYLNDHVDLFAGFSQGYSVPDFGLVLRHAKGGASVETLQLVAQEVDNYELGLRTYWDGIEATLSLFYNESELGTTSGGFGKPPKRAPERVYGVEATLDLTLAQDLRAGGTLSWAEGKYDPLLNGDYVYLDNFRIPPLKLTAYVEHDTRDDWRNRLQLTYSGHRDRFDHADPQWGQREVKSFTTVDWLSELALGQGTLRFGVQNLLNRQYWSREAQQLWSGGNDTYAASRGAVLHIGYSVDW